MYHFLGAIHVNRADQASSVPVLEEQEGAKCNPKLKALLDELLDLFLEELPKYLPHQMAVDYFIDVEPEKMPLHKTP